MFKFKITNKKWDITTESKPRIGMLSDLVVGDIIILEDNKKEYMITEIKRSGELESVYGYWIDNMEYPVSGILPVGNVYFKLQGI